MPQGPEASSPTKIEDHDVSIRSPTHNHSKHLSPSRDDEQRAAHISTNSKKLGEEVLKQLYIPQDDDNSSDESEQQANHLKHTKLFEDTDVSLNEISRSPLVPIRSKAKRGDESSESDLDSISSTRRNPHINGKEIPTKRRLDNDFRLDTELASITEEIEREKQKSTKREQERNDRVLEEVMYGEQKAQSAIPIARAALGSSLELESKLEEMNNEILRISGHNFRLVPGAVVPPPSNPQPTVESTVPAKDIQVISKGLRDCLTKSREILFSVQQLSERVSVLEESNVLPLIDDQKNMAFELRKDVEEFKGKFYDNMSDTIKKAVRKAEAKLRAEMNQQLTQLMDQQSELFQQEMAKQIAHKLTQTRLTHPGNVEIDAYNNKVKFINKKVVGWNQTHQYEGEVLNKKLLMLEKKYPTQVVLEETELEQEKQSDGDESQEEMMHRMQVDLAQKKKELADIHRALKGNK
jgi:hypothetical protein